MASIIKPEDVTGIHKMEPNEIVAFNEEVMKADAALNAVTDELRDLSQSLYSLHQTKERYDKVAKHVRGQMRNMVTKL